MESNFLPSGYFRPAAPSATRTGGLLNGSLSLSDAQPKVDLEKIALGVRLILEGVGENPDREGLQDTPARVARMYSELLYGTHVDPASEVTCKFSEETEELILVKDIPFASICEHHMVPFIGTANIGYIPENGKITGLSKLARVVEAASKRLQVQERMTTEIADALLRSLNPQGVIVILEAEHLCMSIRGIKKPGSKTITSAVRGVIRDNPLTRSEVLSLMNRK
ncbi:MAG: GTP cyclohydrolase I FolE [Candidatus Obscuribacterales bacterium]|nr:GTP cyclohydrolase I FolE [Candidatus Obscuribacterales bacterium]